MTYTDGTSALALPLEEPWRPDHEELADWLHEAGWHPGIPAASHEGALGMVEHAAYCWGEPEEWAEGVLDGRDGWSEDNAAGMDHERGRLLGLKVRRSML